MATLQQCPHGLDRRTCEICRVLETSPSTARIVREPRVVPRPLRGRGRLSLGVGAVLLIVIVVALSQVIAVVWSVFHLLQLVAVAAVAGWVGWKAGVVQGRRSRP